MKFLLKIILILLICAAGSWWLWGENIKDPGNISFHATDKTEVNSSSVSLAIDDILLVKSPDKHLCAIRFDKMTYEPGAEYSTWFIPASSAEKTRPDNIHSSALLIPTILGKNQVEHDSGIIPRRENTKPKQAL